MAQMREANAHLIVAAVRAQTLTEEAGTASHLELAASKNVRLAFDAVAGSRTVSGDAARVLVSDIDLLDEDAYALIRQIRQHEAEHGGLFPRSP